MDIWIYIQISKKYLDIWIWNGYISKRYPDIFWIFGYKTPEFISKKYPDIFWIHIRYISKYPKKISRYPWIFWRISKISMDIYPDIFWIFGYISDIYVWIFSEISMDIYPLYIQNGAWIFTRISMDIYPIYIQNISKMEHGYLPEYPWIYIQLVSIIYPKWSVDICQNIHGYISMRYPKNVQKMFQKQRVYFQRCSFHQCKDFLVINNISPEELINIFYQNLE